MYVSMKKALEAKWAGAKQICSCSKLRALRLSSNGFSFDLLRDSRKTKTETKSYKNFRIVLKRVHWYSRKEFVPPPQKIVVQRWLPILTIYCADIIKSEAVSAVWQAALEEKPVFPYLLTLIVMISTWMTVEQSLKQERKVVKRTLEIAGDVFST